MSCPIKVFTHLQQGAPQLTNAWGSLTALLDAVLINGYNLKPLTSLTSSAGIATATIAAGHLYQVGQILLIEGAAEAAYNGEIRVFSSTSTSFTYTVDPAAPATASGTITAKAAPLGWEIAYTGTNKRAYRSKNPMSNRPLLRVDDGCDPLYNTNYAKFAKVTMAQDMSDIDTFVGARAPFDPANPTRNEGATGSGSSVYAGWYKWIYARPESWTAYDTYSIPEFNRPWTIIGDDRGFYIFIQFGNSYSYQGGHCFTDFHSFKTADGFNTLLTAHDWFISASTSPPDVGSDTRAYFCRSLDFSGKILMRNHLQIGGNERAGFTSLNTNNGQTVSGYSTGISFPNGPDYGMLLHPVYLRQESSHLRGRMPGMMWIHNDSPTFDHGTLITNLAGYPGKTFYFMKLAYGYSTSMYAAAMAFDITGPWW